MSVQRVSHHLLLCATPTNAKCCNPEEGLATWNELKRLIKELGLEKSDRPEGLVLRSKVDCLRICEKGPILLVWPDGIWYSDVTSDKIKKIIYQHIINHKPVQQWVLKKLPFMTTHPTTN